MKKLFITLFALLPGLVFAAGPSIPLDKANFDLTDKVSLQNGAKLFMNYCFGCHATGYQRYERVANDLDIPNEIMMANMVFTDQKIGDLMHNAINKEDAAKWFGAAPPDLTLVARLRGPDWLYTYLRSFYQDPSRPFGVNNTVFPDVGMPHVLEELQGVPKAVYAVEIVDGEEHKTLDYIETDGTGELSADEYDQAVLDMVNFMVYSGEPMRVERERLGVFVLGFIFIFFIISYLLKKEFWRDVH
ncbi:cytochrome c1 [Motilimonas pumila]|uniref:Cytochrome c1 n=1 Tax=Motilimonas pumila TaxID=2303987 RepID=A0A418YIH0_9GAMM|nr:cytochrome c1 [Motilimonas pumila]RJG50021.1 cytochrome c1 [Motilimonas pumila]